MFSNQLFNFSAFQRLSSEGVRKVYGRSWKVVEGGGRSWKVPFSSFSFLLRVNESERSAGSYSKALRVEGAMANIRKGITVHGIKEPFYKRRTICRQQ